MQTQNILINTYTPSDQPVSSTLRAHKIGKSELAWHIAKKLLIYWGLAFVTFFIPVYDVFFVPFFFLIGLYVAVKTEKAEYYVEGGKITCPHCQEPIKLRKVVLTEDYQTTCPHCVTLVKVQLKKSPIGFSAHSEAYGAE